MKRLLMLMLTLLSGGCATTPVAPPEKPSLNLQISNYVNMGSNQTVVCAYTAHDRKMVCIAQDEFIVRYLAAR